MKRKLILSLKFVVAVALLLLLFSFIDHEQFPRMLLGAEPLYLILCLLFSLLMVATSCWKWWLILRLQQQSIPFLRLYRWYFIGYFYSNFLPSNVGGDVVRAWYVTRQIKSASIGLISVFAERFTGIVALLFMAATLPFFLRGPWTVPSVWIVSILALIICVFLLAVGMFGQVLIRSSLIRSGVAVLQQLMRAQSPTSPTHNIWKRTAGLINRILLQGQTLSSAFRQSPQKAFQVMALTFLFYALTVINVALAYRAFGIWPPLREIASVLPTALLVGMVPVSLGNLGIVEGSYVYYFGLAGMAGELTLLVGLFLRFKMLALGLIGWIIQLGCPVIPHQNIQHETTNYGCTDTEHIT